MPFRRPPIRALSLLWLAVLLASCGRTGLVREYEYDEEIFLELDGSATVVVNGSLHALVALHGLAVNPDPGVRFDRPAFRRLYEAPGVEITRVSRPWRRDGRRFVQVRMDVDDIRQLGRVAPLAWSSIRYDADGDQMVYRQRIGESRGTPATGATWTGEELVAFRLHLPSRITFHNAPTREVERGNILSYEQKLSERLQGVPVEIEVRMDQQSIFRRTMVVFGISVGTALVLLTLIVLWVRKKGQATTRAA